MSSPNEPQPISMEDSVRLWNLQQQKKPLSEADAKLVEQAVIWQMWKSHGIRLKDGNSLSNASSRPSKSSLEETTAS